MNNLDFFNINGYVVLEDVFTENECDEMVNIANQLVREEDYVPIMNIHKTSNKYLEYMSNKKIINFIETVFEGNASGLQTEFFYASWNKGF